MFVINEKFVFKPHCLLILIPLTYVLHWDSVPNPDAPRGLCVLHVFAVANTRTRLSQSPHPPFQGGDQASVRTRAQVHRFAVLRPASEDALLNSTILFNPPFQGGTSGPAGFPSPRCHPCPPTPARHLKMPCCGGTITSVRHNWRL